MLPEVFIYPNILLDSKTDFKNLHVSKILNSLFTIKKSKLQIF